MAAVLLCIALADARAEHGVVQSIAPTDDGPRPRYEATTAPPTPATQTPSAASAAAVTSSSHAPASNGPGIEFITGGANANGAAKVGHLPILE